MAQTRHVIGVAMRQNDEIKVGEINTLCLYVGRKDIAIIAGIEQDSLTRDLDKRGEAPILPHCSVLAERVVKYRDLPCARLCVGRGGVDRCRQSYQSSSRKKKMPSH